MHAFWSGRDRAVDGSSARDSHYGLPHWSLSAGTPPRAWSLLVWSKNSCSLTLVVFQQAPKPFATLHWTLTRCAWADHREEQDIALALMIPLVMIMLAILRQRMAERGFPTEDHPREALLLDRAHPALRIGMQVGRAGWQDHTLDTGIIDELLKCGAEFGVAVMDEILAGCQETPLLHGDVAGHLYHPGLIGMWRDASHMDLPTPQMQEK